MRTAIVTGAGSRVGRAVARSLLTAGWSVALAGRRPDALTETAGGHPAALVVPTDVTDPGSVEALFATVEQAWGRLDLLFNNAGVFGGRPGTIDEVSLADWQATIDTNVTGSFLCAAAAFRQMRGQDPQGGRIINNGSISSHVPRPGTIVYTTSKHAITGLTKTLSLDGRPFDIACGQIDIGNATTDTVTGPAAAARQADGSMRPEAVFDVAQVGDAVLFMADLPLGTNVQFLTIAATAMPWIGRG